MWIEVWSNFVYIYIHLQQQTYQHLKLLLKLNHISVEVTLKVKICRQSRHDPRGLLIYQYINIPLRCLFFKDLEENSQ